MADNGGLALRKRLTWRGGHTDLWPLLCDPEATASVAAALAAPFKSQVDVVLGPDPGGVLFGPLVARELGVPFAPICRDRRFFFAGGHETVSAVAGGEVLIMHRAALPEGARALLVDDWSESGATVWGTHSLVAGTPASLVGVALLVDSLPAGIRQALVEADIRVHGLVTPNELGHR